MTYGERSGTRGLAWLVVVLAIIAALTWWWWSGRGPATLSELGVLPPLATADSDSASHASANSVRSASPPAAASDLASSAAPTPGLAREPATALDALPAADGDPPSVAVTGVVTPAESAPATETRVDAESSVVEVVANSDVPTLAADDETDSAAVEFALPESAADHALESSVIDSTVGDLLPPKAAATFLQGPGFARRFVATVDNLGRSYAPASHWPVNPAPDRFTFEERDGRTYIAPDNYKRYNPLVQLVDGFDTRTAVDLYVGMYPQLQQAYADLGFPDASFNDRLLAVMDLLLASPEPSGPLEVERTEVPNAPPPARPWTNYEFADPALDSLTAGQKIMVRVGPDNERKLKAKLAELRQELLTRVLPGS